MTSQLYQHSRNVHGRGLKLLFPASTRWSSVDIAFGRVKALRQSIGKVCYDNRIDDIRAEDYRMVETILKITGPIRRFEQKLTMESVPTISLVYSGIRGLLNMLDNLKVCLAED